MGTASYTCSPGAAATCSWNLSSGGGDIGGLSALAGGGEGLVDMANLSCDGDV
jgi:hypothetical protein